MRILGNSEMGKCGDGEIAAPLDLYRATVRPEWMDYNNHMMDGYYGVPFSHASDALMNFIGLDAEYRARSNCSVYTAEGHILYLREMKVNAPIRITTQLLGYDAKRMHIFHTMYHGETGFVAATCEWMLIHVDVSIGKGAPMPEATMNKLAEIAAQHQLLPIPPQAGRTIGFQSKKK